ncbi:D-aminoacyl-tRNA deacylase 2-like isoform X5 [Oculina patagonica]
MADASVHGAGLSAKAEKPRFLSNEEKANRRKTSYARRDSSRITLLDCFPRWRELRDHLCLPKDKDLAEFLMDFYAHAQEQNRFRDPVDQSTCPPSSPATCTPLRDQPTQLHHMSMAAASPNNGSPSVRIIIQQCLSARLQVQPPTENEDAQLVEISRGIVIYLCFLKGSNLDLVPKVVKSILNVRLSEITVRPTNVSVLELPGDVLIVPQATLGGKMKGKSVQYHSNISKDQGRIFYEKFITLCEEAVHANSAGLSDSPPKHVKHGTYGNRQVLSVETNGPFTHVFDF